MSAPTSKPAVAPVPEAVNFRPAPKVNNERSRPLPGEVKSAELKASVPPMAAPVPAAAPAAPAVKPTLFQPQFVKVKDGIAYIYASFGETLLYIEAEVQKRCGPVKVWVIEKSKTVQSALELRTAPAFAKLSALSDSGRAKFLSVTEPIYASVANGILRIQGSIDSAKLYVEIKASEYWTACTEQALALRQVLVERRLKPLEQMYASSKDKVVALVQPYYVRGRDGALQIRATVGDTLVNIKLGVSDKMDRFQNAALAAYGNVSTVIASYMSPIVTRVVAMYETISNRLLNVFGPYLANVQEGVTFGRARIQGVLVAIKVRAGAAYQRAAALPAACYVTINKGFIYLRGEVGGKAVLLKVKLSEIYDRAMEIVDMTKVKILGAREVTKTKIMAISAGARSAAGEQGVQVAAASAAGGAMAVGATGGATGLLVGGALGAACGVPLSFFTFGLSIPVGAAIGGGTGLVAGSAAGGAVGGAVGGVAGRKVYHKREAIADGVTAAVSKVSSYKELAVEKAGNCKTIIGESATGLRARMGA